MRAKHVTCLTLGVSLAALAAASPAKAAPCAEFFPFVCLFGPEAEAMMPAPPVLEYVAADPEPLELMPRRRRTVAKKSTTPRVEKAQEAAAAPETKAQEVPMSVASVARPGPGLAFNMSLRLSPTMQEPVSPPTTACVVEQTFNELFRYNPEDLRKTAEIEATPISHLALVSIKTGTATPVDTVEIVASIPATAYESVRVTELKHASR